MSKMAKITFSELIQDIHDLETDNPNEQVMRSRALFALEINGREYGDMSVVLKQPFGTNYAQEPLEVEKPMGPYDCDKWNHNAFHDAVEHYYRSAIGNQSAAINLGPGARRGTGCRMWWKNRH
jgi:hypothetical protein